MKNLSYSGNKHTQLDSLILLRALAVMLVCFCHFGDALSPSETSSSLFQLFATNGKYGVQIFFVISGFIIPFSLVKGKYSLNDYLRFLYKRILRLHPPYLAALVCTLLIMYLSYGVRHIPFPENSSSILKSIFYFHFPADNPVFWTLAVEAQYYIFIGLFYILLVHNTKLAYFIAIPIILAISSVSSFQYISLQTYIIFFFIGNICCMIFIKDNAKAMHAAMLAALLIFTAYFYETAEFAATLFTIIVIFLFKQPLPKYIKFIGNISYSIYLIHFPLGVKFINLIKPKISPSFYWPLFIITLLLSIGAAWAFYNIFEEFSENLSKKIKYTAASKQDASTVTSNGYLLPLNKQANAQ